MAEILGVRALHRSQRVRIGTKQLKTNVTTFINLSNPRVRRDLNNHSTLGAFLTVTPLTFTADSGYVLQGGAVAQTKPTANLVVNIASGVARINGNNVPFAATTKTVTAADATNPRYDIITVTSGGSVVYTAGTASATPKLPDVPANSTTLATINVPANTTQITETLISDVR